MRLPLFFLLVLFFLKSFCGFSQGLNHRWLLGYWPNPSFKAKILFDTTSYTLLLEQRKMGFEGTEATICDANGNFLMSSNGVWIANANNDTMMNGSGLNPGSNVISNPRGLLITYGNTIVPYPEDSSKYILFHQTGASNANYPSFELYYSIIDRTLDGGLGGVTSKNNIIFQDTIGWGLGICKHANGRDWWVVAMKDSSDVIYKVLYTPNGVESITTQNLNFNPVAFQTIVQLTFSQDGTQFITTTYDNPQTRNSSAVLFDFDRCTGVFSHSRVVPLSTASYIWGLAFSASGKYAYACSSQFVFQIDTDILIVDTVSTYDGFISGAPPTCCASTFWNMYLAANGKIYITSGSGVQHIHEMNYPDSAGVACDVQQHAINLGVWNFRAVPNHPNYYLGPVNGSICDSLGLSVSENNFDFHFSLFPNPVTNGSFNISYLMPQNKNGTLEIFDINGKRVYAQTLPQWSTLQQIKLLHLSNGLYNCSITSGNNRVSKKVAVVNE